jgi:hypothetical protein
VQRHVWLSEKTKSAIQIQDTTILHPGSLLV